MRLRAEGPPDEALVPLAGAEPAARWAVIEVSDTGPGISPEAARCLFDPFYSGREAGRGLGFGLSKCWRTVTRHGGAIALSSQPGRGATFTIRLPLAAAADAIGAAAK